MDELTKQIEKHYYKQDLYEDIVNKLQLMGFDIESVNRKDISSVDEFHVRGAEISKEMSKNINLNGLEVLDVGCGIGGPCRMLADEFNCNVTGIDLSNEFIETATKLSKLVKLDNKTNFIVGDATNLPFDNNSFDIVWTQHVQMNVPDKTKFYSEIQRVLRPKSHFLYYDIFKANNETVNYPMPWASNESQSFLFKNDTMDSILSDLGFEKISSKNQTSSGIEFFESMVKKLKQSGPPKLGLNVLMGSSTKPKVLNLLEHFKSGKLMLESGHYSMQN